MQRGLCETRSLLGRLRPTLCLVRAHFAHADVLVGVGNLLAQLLQGRRAVRILMVERLR